MGIDKRTVASVGKLVRVTSGRSAAKKKKKKKKESKGSKIVQKRGSKAERFSVGAWCGLIAAYLLLHKLVIPGTIKQTADFGGGRDTANVEEKKRARDARAVEEYHPLRGRRETLVELMNEGGGQELRILVWQLSIKKQVHLNKVLHNPAYILFILVVAVFFSQFCSATWVSHHMVL